LKRSGQEFYLLSTTAVADMAKMKDGELDTRGVARVVETEVSGSCLFSAIEFNKVGLVIVVTEVAVTSDDEATVTKVCSTANIDIVLC
jgi:hypothetical protein